MLDDLHFNSFYQSKQAKIEVKQEDFEAYMKPKTIVQLSGDKALVDVQGTFMTNPSILDKMFGNCINTMELINTVNYLAKDDKIKNIVFAVNSGGGSAEKIHILADAVYALNAVKNCVTVNIGCMASAAYFAFSQVSKIYSDDTMNRTGSIGTKAVFYDTSKAMEQQGVKVVAVKTGEFKTLLEQGMPITNKDIEVIEELVNEMQQNFENAVKRTRKAVNFEGDAEAKNGLAFTFQKAKQLGLIDGIKTVEQAFEELSQKQRMKALGIK